MIELKETWVKNNKNNENKEARWGIEKTKLIQKLCYINRFNGECTGDSIVTLQQKLEKQEKAAKDLVRAYESEISRRETTIAKLEF